VSRRYEQTWPTHRNRRNRNRRARPVRRGPDDQTPTTPDAVAARLVADGKASGAVLAKPDRRLAT